MVPSTSVHLPGSPIVPSSHPQPQSLPTRQAPFSSMFSASADGGCPFGGGSGGAALRAPPHPLPPLHATPPSVTPAPLTASGPPSPMPCKPPDTTPPPSNNKSATTSAPKETSSLGISQSGRGTVYYPDYLRLPQLLSCQHPISFQPGNNRAHDEMLFITIHQTYELWFKQIIFELDSVRSILAELNIGEKSISLALHRLTRIREIQKLLNDQIRVLETMTPQEFLEFRDYLFPASGFQSFQFRLLEIKLGVTPQQRPNSRWIMNIEPEHQHILHEAQQQPSLFDYVERWLRNIPFREFRGYSFQRSYESAVKRMFEIERENIQLRIVDQRERDALLSDLSKMFRSFESVYNRDIHEELLQKKLRRMGLRATSASLMIMLYQDEPMFQLPARLLHMLMDVDEQMSQWRYRHSQMVHRMIGVKVGTGGALGHSYLRRTLETQRVFTDIANLSTLLIPRRLLPQLPTELSDQMKYFHAMEKYDRSMFEMGGGGDEIDWSFC